VPEVPAALHAEYEKAAKAERTAQNYEDWRTDTITQAAAAWVLSCVFVRFLEDNSLIDPPKIAGPGDLLARARDEHELYFRSHPQHTDREYLLSIFSELARLPGTRDIFGEHNAINDLPNWLSGDAVGELLNFFQKIDASTGELVHDFSDPNWDTRFLGDLYQDLSEAARKKFALLQTPDFVEEFILDRTLEPAIKEFGLVPEASSSGHKASVCFKMIDPACGSGHFLLGAFPRLLERWQRYEPGTNIRELTQRALDSIHGVDINPFAVAIAKFRLLLVAMKGCSIRRLDDAPGFRIHVACGDSLLHGENRTSTGQRLWDYAEGATDEELYTHAYPGEDLQTVRNFLQPGTYHCVVANPPYIVPKDRKLNDWYRKRFSACHMKYSLAVPFMQQIFQLAIPKGYTGQITANSFMKREFGKKLIEAFFPTIDLTHVIDTSGAYIPGHGTPTTIIFGRNNPYVGSTLRTVLGIRGEPSTPDDPSRGIVWSSIVDFIDQPNRQNEFVSSGDSERGLFHKHPWSIGGGGASELKELLDGNAKRFLGDCVANIGVMAVTLEDDAYAADSFSLSRNGIAQEFQVGFVEGDSVRDWSIRNVSTAIFPYQKGESLNPYLSEQVSRRLWPLRTGLRTRLMFGKTQIERGFQWYEYGMLIEDKFTEPLSIAFAFVAWLNYFVLDRGGNVFNRSAPVIKLRPGASIDEHINLVGLLNSSVSCFWMKQVTQIKTQTTGMDAAAWQLRREFDATKLKRLPLCEGVNLPIAAQLDLLGRQLTALTPSAIINLNCMQVPAGRSAISSNRLRKALDYARSDWDSIRAKMIYLQEELDWQCYKLYGVIDDDLCNSGALIELNLGQRAFEIALARQDMLNGSQSTWFERHGSKSITDLPMDWPSDYKDIVDRRLEAIEQIPQVALIERPEYKRRWEIESWGSRLDESLCAWFLHRMESYFDFDGRMSSDGDVSTKPAGNVRPLGEIAMYSLAQLADAASQDPHFVEVGEVYRGDPAFDVQALVEELVLAESVPHLPILRYKNTGLRKRAEWEKTWDLQRREDAGESVGTIPVPPKYTSADFISTGGARYWSLRGKLDVPKERWISFPHCEGPDGTLVICWAGYDHLQQAQAISAYYVRVQTEFGGSDDPRLIPLLASLIELLPWLKQWHNEPNANFDGLRMGDYFEGFVNEEARNMGKTLQEIRDWVPPKKLAKTTAPKRASKKAKSVEVDE
jgi:hypothetical protein